MRLQADFDNFRRRTRENDAKAADIYKAETLKSFLPVLDNFELALAHMKRMNRVKRTSRDLNCCRNSWSRS